MTVPTILPRDQERPFGRDELFFSTTDRKGVITSGNDVFVRVSGHSREELIGSAHNIIRHPDMPRAVFKMLWDHLDAGGAFAGYVKNLAADGCYYWVVALIVPMRLGYLSIRFKPSSPLFPLVKALYAELLAIERSSGAANGSWRAGMQRAGEVLGAKLRSLGFASYIEFMQTMLAAELATHRDTAAALPAGIARGDAGGAGELQQMLAECAHLDRQLDELFSEVNGVLAVTTNLDGKATFLLTLSSDIHLVALNAVISSCREAGGDGFAVVTQNLAVVSQESTSTIDTMTRQLTVLTSSLRETAFSITTAKLQVEMTVFFLRELIAASRLAEGGMAARPDIRDEIEMLTESFSASTIQLATAIPRVRQAIPGLLRLQNELAGDLRKLAIVRLLGKIHATGLAEERHCRELLDQILAHSQQATVELEEMSSGVDDLRRQLPTLERSASTVNHPFQGRPVARHPTGVTA